jgi:hypothetical protein
LTEYTPLSRFRRLIGRVNDLAATFGQQLATRVVNTDPRLTNSRTPTGAAGGVLADSYPNPSFAVDMATQEELDAGLALRALLTNTSIVVPTYADNIAALSGGLAVNRIYQTETGELRIVI